MVGLAVEGRAEERLERPETIAESKPSAARALVTARKQATPTQPKLYTSCLYRNMTKASYMYVYGQLANRT